MHFVDSQLKWIAREARHAKRRKTEATVRTPRHTQSSSGRDWPSCSLEEKTRR